MGVKGLLVFVRGLNPEVKKKFNFSDLKGTKVAVDVAIQTFQYKSRFRSDIVEKMDILNDEINFKDETEFMVRSYLVLCYNLLKAEVVPVSVFDGIAPDLKIKTQAQRRGKYTHSMDKIERLRKIGKILTANTQTQLEEEDLIFLRDGFPKPITTIGSLMDRLKSELKACIKVTQEDRNQIIFILKLLGLPVMQAPSEAEFLCSQLCVQKKITAVISTDSDCLMYSCPILITKVTYLGGHIIPKPPQGELYIFKDVLKITGLTPLEFKDFCIMCGTDFNDNSPGIGPKGNFTLISTFKSIKNIVKAREFLIAHMEEKGLTEKDLSKNDKMLFKLDPSCYNYPEVSRFMSTPAKYNEEDLCMKFTLDHYQKVKPLLVEKIPESLYKKCEVYLDRILECMTKSFKPTL